MSGLFFIAYRSIDIPSPNSEYLTQTTHVYYADGKTDLGQFAIQDRDPIGLDEVPDTLKDAVVAAEDQSFWTNEGIDPKGILRAAFRNASGNVTQGGSTITQQYVKILYLTQTTHVYYADGKTDLGQFAIQDRDPIDLDEMPETLKDAVVAAEDQSFWTNQGIDPKGIIRAAFSNASGGVTQGASTLSLIHI